MILPADPPPVVVSLLLLFECDDDDFRSFLMLFKMLLSILWFNLLSKYLYASIADFIPNSILTSLTIVLGRCCKINCSRYLQYNVFKFYKEIVKGLLLDICLLYQFMYCFMVDRGLMFFVNFLFLIFNFLLTKIIVYFFI